MHYFKNALARCLKKPERGLFGYLATLIFKKKNSFLERNAVELCEISPEMKLLEVGFGPGIGLKAAYEKVQAGSGIVCGVDISEYMVDMATKHLQKECSEGKVRLYLGSVDNLPFDTEHFDRIFHCNSYQFWPNQPASAGELWRVLKRGGIMVTTLNLQSLRLASRRGLLALDTFDPLRYMCALEEAGFADVRIQYTQDGKTRADFEAIYAHKP